MGNFVMKKNRSGKFFFSLKAGNGATIAVSQSYSNQQACEVGIESVRKNSVVSSVEDQTIRGFTEEKNPKFEIFKDKVGEFRFRLKAANGEIILQSEGYTVKASCKNGIASVVKNAPEADIIEE